MEAQTAVKPKASQVKVKAVVSKHGDFKGFWSGGVFFPNGTSVRLVLHDRVKEIEADSAAGHRIAIVAMGEEVSDEVTESIPKMTVPPAPPVGAPSGADADALPGSPNAPGKRIR